MLPIVHFDVYFSILTVMMMGKAVSLPSMDLILTVTIYLNCIY